MTVTQRGSGVGGGDDESFIPNYMSWGDKRMDGLRKTADQALGQRGMNFTAGLRNTQQKLQSAADNPANAPDYRATADRGARNAGRMMDAPGVGDYRTSISDITKRYGGFLGRATQRGVDSAAMPTEERHVSDTGEIPGTAWYFNHRRSQTGNLDPAIQSTPRMTTAMGGKLSSGKTPEDEQVSMRGITHLAGSLANRMLNSRRVSSWPSPDIASMASQAAAWGSHEDELAAGKKTRQPSSEKPRATAPVYTALREAGRAHEPNVAVATQVARREITPQEGFGESTPKTGPYAEMQAQSNPGSLVETDYRNISAHYRDIAAGSQSRDQGMMMFSQDEPGKRAHALAPDTPTAIDTWMLAAGSGQPMSAKGEKGHTYSPAKRGVDKAFPLDPSAPTKASMGIPEGDPSINSTSVLSAQHNEAIRRLSMNTIGAVSHDQHGQDIYLPSSLIQETVWTQARREAGEDPAFSASNREAAGREKTKAKKQAASAKSNKIQTLF